MVTAERVMTYVDGLNLYHGIRHAGLSRYLWLDISKLASSLLHKRQKLEGTKYFVARFAAQYGPAPAAHQNAHLRALQAIEELEIIEGSIRTHLDGCSNCGFERPRHEEKMTDVNIAVELVLDAEDDEFDTALLITADADLTGPIRRLQERHPGKRFIVAFPPKRSSLDLKNAANGFVHVNQSILRKSQLPDRMRTDGGGVVVRPKEWSAG